ncbi:MAG TPA: MarR family winged helix-turn-helix transcriptional regulator [Gaiellaceae bacterium]
MATTEPASPSELRQRLLDRWAEPNPAERSAWTGFLRAHSRITKALDRELAAAHDLPLSEYDVLAQLALRDDGRLRMSDLAEAIVLSPSGLTRLVDRLARRGLLRRERCDADSRVVYATITAAGLEKLVEATPTHLDGIRRLFWAHLTDEQSEELASIVECLGRRPE